MRKIPIDSNGNLHLLACESPYPKISAFKTPIAFIQNKKKKI